MIGTIANPLEAATTSATGAEIYERFSAEPGTLAIAVIDDDRRPVGLIERNSFTLKLGAEFGRALWGKRPVTAIMDPRPLIVDAAIPVDRFLADAVRASPVELLHGFIVVEDGRYLGVGTALNLLIAASEENVRRARAVESMAQDLQSREASARLLFEENPVPLFVVDQATQEILRANEAAELAWGRCLGTLLGRRITDYLVPEQRAIAGQRLAGEAPRPPGAAYTVLDIEGRAREVVPYLRPLTFEGRAAMLAAVIDVSERREAEAALAKARDVAEAANRTKSEFLANISHEIRTPLNGVLGVTSVLSQTALDARQRELVGVIESSAETLQVLLTDLLDLARVEAGRLEISQEPFHMGEACRAVAELFRAKAEEKGLTFTVALDPAVDRAVVGDAVRLKQIVGNLLSNAIKFTHEGEVRLSARRLAAGPDGLGFQIQVQDTGIGFSEAAKGRLFARFSQADGSITREYGGSGLGLSISAGLAKLLGGVLDAESVEGRGSTFRLEIRLPEAQQDQDAASAGEGPACWGARERPVRILLAEDHPINRKVVELIFDSQPVELVIAEDGEVAVSLFERQAFDVILMDMQMPRLDGLGATRAIRALEARAGRARTPVVMLSANALPEHESAGRAAGADLYLTKPIEAARLLATVQRALAAPAAFAERLAS